jgi:hypothetical protein
MFTHVFKGLKAAIYLVPAVLEGLLPKRK